MFWSYRDNIEKAIKEQLDDIQERLEHILKLLKDENQTREDICEYLETVLEALK